MLYAYLRQHILKEKHDSLLFCSIFFLIVLYCASFCLWFIVSRYPSFFFLFFVLLPHFVPSFILELFLILNVLITEIMIVVFT